MKKCVVYFDPSLSDHDISQRIDAFLLIHGISRVDPPMAEDSVAQPFSSPGISVPSKPPSSINRPPKHTLQDSPIAGADPTIEISTEADVSRQVINQSIRWGLQNGMIQANQIEKLEAAQLVELAMKLLDDMPEDLKQQIGSSLQ